jgi:hypothetical protein
MRERRVSFDIRSLVRRRPSPRGRRLFVVAMLVVAGSTLVGTSH